MSHNSRNGSKNPFGWRKEVKKKKLKTVNQPHHNPVPKNQEAESQPEEGSKSTATSITADMIEEVARRVEEEKPILQDNKSSKIRTKFNPVPDQIHGR